MSDEKLPVHRSGFVVIVGEANAGKSTLLNTLLGTKVSIVSSKPHTTRKRILGILNAKDSQIVFVDTPGFVFPKERTELSRYLRSVLSEATTGGDLVLLVVDAKVLLSGKSTVSGIKQMLRDQHIAFPRIIAINKVDLVEKDLLLPLMSELSKEFLPAALEPDQAPPIELIPISARHNDGLDILLKVLKSMLPEGPKLFPEDMVSDQPEKFLASEVIREKLFFCLSEELPYSLAVMVEDWVEDETLLRIHAVIVVERPSQKAIVIGKNGQKLKEVGTLARIELEKIFNTHVFLKLLVRVEPNWTRTAHGLQRAGYWERSY